MKLERLPKAQTGPSAEDHGERKKQNKATNQTTNPKNLTTMFQKVHTFLQEDNSNIPGEWATANKMSLPWRGEMTH